MALSLFSWARCLYKPDHRPPFSPCFFFFFFLPKQRESGASSSRPRARAYVCYALHCIRIGLGASGFFYMWFRLWT
ncbi:uncharacterized protein BDV14DRAFT_128723 [Aspergillus stella-maris]|uniref:uncharacterized protein n=1 Tax=Aspergillus stella-maris TaxID=1810926 RepID=UPI003CCDA1E3